MTVGSETRLLRELARRFESSRPTKGEDPKPIPRFLIPRICRDLRTETAVPSTGADGNELLTDAARERLRSHGVEFRSEDHGNALSVYCHDPDGHVLELTTYVR